MIRIFLPSLLLLIVSTSCSISKRQHLSGYHVDFQPSLKKSPKLGAVKEEQIWLNNQKQADPKGIISYPFSAPSFKVKLPLKQRIPEIKLKKKGYSQSSEAIIASTKLDFVAYSSEQGQNTFIAQKTETEPEAANPKIHNYLFTAALFLALIALSFFAFSITAAPGLLSGLIPAFFAILSGILFGIVLILGLIFYLRYRKKKKLEKSGVASPQDRPTKAE